MAGKVTQLARLQFNACAAWVYGGKGVELTQIQACLLQAAAFSVWSPCTCCQSEQTMMHPYAFRNIAWLFVVLGIDRKVYYKTTTKRGKR